MVRDVCGIHAQLMSASELSIWARVTGVTSEYVQDEVWKNRHLVKTWAMRGTLHLLAAGDLPLYVGALRSRQGYKAKAWLKFYKLTLQDIEAVITGVREVLDGRNLTRDELAKALGRRVGSRVQRELASGWGSLLKPAAYQGNLCFGPSRGQNVTFVRPDQWLGKWAEHDSEDALKKLLLRYLTAYGPATHEDFGRWFGILPGKARALVKSSARELEEVEIEGRHCWLHRKDLKKIETIRATPPVRLLPNFDSYVLGYYPRERLCPQGLQSRVFRPQAWVSPVVLIDGMAAGTWNQNRRRGKVEVRVEPFLKLNSEQIGGVEDEAKLLEEFYRVPVELTFSK